MGAWGVGASERGGVGVKGEIGMRIEDRGLSGTVYLGGDE